VTRRNAAACQLPVNLSAAAGADGNQGQHPADLEPCIDLNGFVGVQRYRLVLFGEKTSLRDVLGPGAEERQTDLYLPTGEISDTQLHRMAEVGAADGRPMIVFTFSDCDPSGWQMPVSIARKLQAFKALEFPDLDFQVHRVALTPEQVGEHQLPESPLKTSEKRAGKWKQRMGVEQTEINALVTLDPDLLRRIALDAIAPFYDDKLDDRVRNDAIAAEADGFKPPKLPEVPAPEMDGTPYAPR
jgi:hypothetical protein